MLNNKIKRNHKDVKKIWHWVSQRKDICLQYGNWNESLTYLTSSGTVRQLTQSFAAHCSQMTIKVQWIIDFGVKNIFWWGNTLTESSNSQLYLLFKHIKEIKLSYNHCTRQNIIHKSYKCNAYIFIGKEDYGLERVRKTSFLHLCLKLGLILTERRGGDSRSKQSGKKVKWSVSCLVASHSLQPHAL